MSTITNPLNAITMTPCYCRYSTGLRQRMLSAAERINSVRAVLERDHVLPEDITAALSRIEIDLQEAAKP